ncbi:MAG: DMT family transporter [Eggerthellaceae bacterium]|nr:DMT family transporter [Eggerthellaceae bacterium]
MTFCWSTEVVIFANIPDTVSPFATTSITFLVGGTLLLFAFLRRVRTGLRKDGRKQLLRCVFLSVLNAAYNIMYQFGLRDFDVSTGAFTLALTVVALPLILVMQRQQVNRRSWISSAVVLVGITIALIGQVTSQQIPGLGIIAAGCVLRAYYIIKLNQYAREHDPVVLSVLVCLSGGILSYFFWMAVQPNTFFGMPWAPDVVASLAVYSYFVIALTVPLNFFAQRKATPASATVIYAMEIAFTVLWTQLLPANLIDPVQLTPTLLAGVALVIAGNLVEILDVGALLGRSGGEAA